MIPLNPEQTQSLTPWFLPDLPGVAPGLHVMQTGQGSCHVDRWPQPQAALFNAAGNYSLVGDANALTTADLTGLIQGFVETEDAFLPLLHKAFPTLKAWDRVMHDLEVPPRFAPLHQGTVRRLTAGDAQALRDMSGECRWVWKTWGSPESFVSSGYSWGIFSQNRLVSVACTFFVGLRFEEIGIVTESAFRGSGLGTICAGKLCEDIQQQGKTPSWTTSPDNVPSLRIAEKLGFRLKRRIQQYVIEAEIPEAP